MKKNNFINSTFGIYKGLNKSIYVLFFARVINSIGCFVFPFLTLYLTDKLAYSTTETGRIILYISISFVPGSLLGGKLSDVFGRKKLLVIAQILSAICFLLCAGVENKELLPVFVIIAEFFMGIVRPVTTAMVIDLSKPENRKASFSFLYLGHNIGFAVGPVFAGLLYNSRPNWLFSGDALTTILATIFVILLVKESKPSDKEINNSLLLNKEKKSLESAEKGSVFRVLISRPGLLIFMFFITLIHFVYAQMTFALPIFMNDSFKANGPALYGSLMTINGVIVILGTTLIIGLTKNIKPIFATILTATLNALGFGILYFVTSFELIVVVVFIWTIGEILGATNIDVYIANHTPMSHRGRINSIVPIITGAGSAVSPMLVGFFIDKFSIRLVWPLCAIVAGIAGLGLFFLYLYDKKVHR